MSTLSDAIQYIRMGNKAEGRQILEELLDVDENNEEVWLWLSSVVDTDDDREICLENALALDPESVIAKKGLEALNSGIFSTDELLRELLVDEEGPVQGEEEEPVTFLDDFTISDEHDLDDDDFDISGYDDESDETTGRKFNPRIIILGVLVLILIVVLGALAVASMSLMGGDGGNPTPDTGQQNQEAPADPQQQQPEATPTPADTPTPEPTATPTETPTPALRLPTAKPTVEPSPTATQVVSPTPIKN